MIFHPNCSVKTLVVRKFLIITFDTNNIFHVLFSVRYLRAKPEFFSAEVIVASTQGHKKNKET